VLFIERWIRRLPPGIGDLPALRAISLPIELTGPLFKLPTAQHLVRLEIQGEGALVPPCPLPSVATIAATMGGREMLRFTPSDFPSLRHAELYTRGGKTIFDLACGLPLQILALWPVPKSYDLTRLPPTLHRLQLQDGTADNLRPLTHLRDLSEIRLRNLHRLTSLEPLRDLPKLAEVFLLHCPALDLTPLLHIDTLKTAWVLGYRDERSMRVKATLAERGVVLK
jgi:hypothetical protein